MRKKKQFYTPPPPPRNFYGNIMKREENMTLNVTDRQTEENLKKKN